MVRPLRVFPDTGTPTTLGQMQDSDRIDRLMLPSRVAPFSGVRSISIIAPPPSPADGDAYLIPAGAEGAWASNVGNATCWDGPTAQWLFYGPFEGWQLWVDALGHPITYTGTVWLPGPFNPMTTAGDMEVAASGGVPGRLAPGVNGQVLTMVAGVPAWSSSASAFPAYSVANNNEVLTIVAGVPAWANIPAQLPGSSSANNAQVLTVVSGNPAWAGLPSQLPGYSVINNGQVLTISAGSPSWLSPASGLPASTGANNGQVLTVVAGSAAWAVAPSQAVPFDMLSNPVNPVHQVTAAATASLNTWNFCKASSPYSLSLPSASANQGVVLGIEIDPFATALVTLAGYGGTDFIDYDTVNGTPTGRTTRIMQAGESAELKSTLSSTGVWYWHKTGGRSIPMTAALSNGGAQTFAASAETVLTFSTTVFNNGPSGLVVPASYRFVIQRPGTYQLTSSLVTNSTNASQTAITQRLYKNGAAIFTAVGPPVVATNSGPLALAWSGNLAAGDYLQLALVYYAGSFTTSVLIYADNTHNLFSLTEVSPW